MERALGVFAKWFASATGVWQTFFLVAAVVVFEFVNPGWDPSGFYLLYWLTVYSAVTQPALAFVAVRADVKTDAILRHLEQMVGEGIHLDEEQLAAIKQIRG